MTNGTEENQALLAFLADQARLRIPALSNRDRIRLNRAIALIVDAAEAEQCRLAASVLEEAEDAQSLLDEMFETRGGKSS